MGERDIYAEYATPVSEAILGGFDDDGDPGTGSDTDATATDTATIDATDATDATGGTELDDSDDDKGNRSPTIPRGRFDEVHKQAKQYKDRAELLEAELAELKANQQQGAPAATRQDTGGDGAAGNEDGGSDPAAGAGTEPIDILDLEKQYLDAFDLGDTALALEIRGKINGELERRAEERVTKTFAQREENTKRAELAANLKTAAEEVVKTYPILNTDKDLVSDVFDLRNTLAKTRNMPLDKALLKAAAMICGGQGATPPGASTTTPANKGNQRLEETIKRNMQESQQQPAKLDAAGSRSQHGAERKPSEISQEEWDKMPEDKRMEALS